MIINNGEEVFIFHFSSKVNIKSTLLAAEGNLLTLQTGDGRSYYAMSPGEPAVLFFVTDSSVIITGCVISERSARDIITVVSDNEYFSTENRRMYERYPVSYYADLKVVNEQKRYVAYLKDISKYGLKIITDAELIVGRKVEISLYLEKKILFITTMVVRGTKGEKLNEYGTVITIEDFHSVREMSNLIRLTTQEYTERFVNSNLLNDKLVANYELNYDSNTNRFALNENKNIEAIVAKLGDIIRRTKY